MAEEFNPEIITFACNWCAYSAVMCSGQVNPNFILKALQLGADGVLVAG